MISEQGTIVRIEADCLWVDTIVRSTCGSCRAKSGCGQKMMSDLMGHTPLLRVLLDGRDPAQYFVNQTIDIAIPEDVIAWGSLFIYLMPILSLMLCAGIAQTLWERDLLTLMAGVVGLLLGGLIVKMRAYHQRNNRRIQPILVDDFQSIRLGS